MPSNTSGIKILITTMARPNPIAPNTFIIFKLFGNQEGIFTLSQDKVLGLDHRPLPSRPNAGESGCDINSRRKRFIY